MTRFVSRAYAPFGDMMQPEEFKAIAIEIYGDGWAKKLGIALSINDKSAREMANGYRPIPEAAASLLRQLYDWHCGGHRGH